MNIFDLIYIPILGFMDRLRGSSFGIGKTPEAFIYGLFVSGLLFGIPQNYHSGIVNISFALLFLAGSSLGWGQPIGWMISGNKTGKYESWQKGILEDNVHLAVLTRGLIWGLPSLILLYWTKDVIPFAVSIPISFYLAAFISKFLVKKEIKYAWEFHEVLRGILLGSGIILIKELL